MQRKTFQLPDSRRLLCILYKNPYGELLENWKYVMMIAN